MACGAAAAAAVLLLLVVVSPEAIAPDNQLIYGV